MASNKWRRLDGLSSSTNRASTKNAGGPSTGGGKKSYAGSLIVAGARGSLAAANAQTAPKKPRALQVELTYDEKLALAGVLCNCLECGRIVWDFEGPAECPFCQAFLKPPKGTKAHRIAKKMQKQIIKQRAKANVLARRKARASLAKPGAAAADGNDDESDSSDDEASRRAEAAKNRLVVRDQASEHTGGPRVVDDEADFFVPGGGGVGFYGAGGADALEAAAYGPDASWLTEEQRAELLSRSEAARVGNLNVDRSYTVSFDFAGRRVRTTEQGGDDVCGRRDA